MKTENSVNGSRNPEYAVNEKNKVVGGVLYLVATPIGNLADISYRAVKVLGEVDFIAAEDTRNTGKLLSCLGINNSMISYHEHNIRQRGEEICSRLISGESCALVTDAGTPAISDPGEDIVSLCIEKGITVTSVPGCCAAVNALILSGLPTGRFVFEGFLNGTNGEKNKRLEELRNEYRTLIFYEAPHRLIRTLKMMYDILGNRKISLCREMTKLNEEIIRTDLEHAVNLYDDGEHPKGEYVLIVSGCDNAGIENDFWSGMDIIEHVQYYIDRGMDKNEAIKTTAKDRGLRKNEVYNVFVNN